MAGTPYIRFFGDEWTSGTQSLTLEERGALVTIVALIASTGEPPAYDLERLSRRFGCTRAKTAKIIQALVDVGKLRIEDGRLIQPRAMKESKKAQENSKKQSENARERWQKKDENDKENKGIDDAVALPRECQLELEPDIRVVELSSSAETRRAMCFKAAGLDPLQASAIGGLISTIDIERMIRDPTHPCDFKLDVLPAIESCAATLRKRKQTLTNWSYCREAIFRNRDQRLQGNPAPTEQTAGHVQPKPSVKKHAGGGVAASAIRIAAKLRESRGEHDDSGGEPEPFTGSGMGEVFSNHRRIAGPG